MDTVQHSASQRFRIVVATLLAVVLAAFIAAAPLTGPVASAAPEKPVPSSGSTRVQVLTPASGSVHVARTKAAAAATHLRAKVRLTGPITSATAKLNGHPLSVKGSGRTRTVRLDKADGLRVGQNLLWVSANVRGSKQPAQVADRFVVGYRVSGLLTSSGIQLGGGSAPAAALSLQAPLKGVNQTTATLNGKKLKLPGARPAKGGHRSLDLNLAQLGGLRFGHNTLVMRIAMNDGRVQDLRHPFSLDRNRDIAVARVTGRPAAVGRSVTLDASASRLAGRGRTLQAHWTLIRKPNGSQTRLGAMTGKTITLHPDVPGTYRVAMRTGTGKNAGYDVLDVAATYPEPLVPFDSDATQGGKTGLQVGTIFYPYDNQPIQEIVLDRRTLEATHDNTYPTTTQGITSLENNLQILTSSDLVVVTVPDGVHYTDPTWAQLDDALAKIGGSHGEGYQFQDSSCWSGHTYGCPPGGYNAAGWQRFQTAAAPFTVIGVPGMPAGQAWRETAHQVGAYGGTSSGRLTGYLTLGVSASTGTSNVYTFIHGPDPYVPVDTCADVGGNTCAVSVGGHTYPAAGANGYHVVVLDRTTLAMLSNRTVSTFGDLRAAINTSNSGTPPWALPVAHSIYPDVNSTAGGQGDQKLVIVQSVGNGKLTGEPSTYLWQDLTQLGGTPETLKASADGAHPYALVGVANNLPWYGTAGIESSTVMGNPVGAPGQPTGHVNGELQRDRSGLYTPASGDPSGAINTEFYSILYQPAQDWPYSDDPALPYIATGIGLGGYPDVRSAYTDLNIDWDAKAGALRDLTCTGQSFCGSDFGAVQTQLLTEFEWVQTVRNFITNLLSPYTQNGTGSIFAVDAIYDDIYNSLPPPPTARSSLDWLGITGDTFEVASSVAGIFEAKEASEALSLIGSGLALANNFMQKDDGTDAETVTSDAPDELSAQLVDQEAASVKAIDHMETILLSDYGRLSAVGSKAGGGDPSWAWTPDTTINSITALNASTRSASYTTLIPEIYAATDLEPNSSNGANNLTTNDVTAYECSDDHHPFYKALPENQFHAITRVDSNGNPLSDVWTFANKVSSGSPQMPTTSLTDDIYGPDSTGADGAFQYGPDWWRRTYNPPGGVMCNPPHDGTSWDAPDIPLPLP